MDGVLRRCFICIKFTGYPAPTWPHSQTIFLPYRATMLCSSTFYSLRLKSSFNTWYFSPPYCGHPLLFLFISSSLSFHLGERAYEKRSNILAEVLMVLEIELWTIDPHIPGPKMRPPSRILGCPRSCFPELGSWQTLPFRTQSITAQKGISPFSCHPPPFHLKPEEPVLTKFRKSELHWVNVGS